METLFHKFWTSTNDCLRNSTLIPSYIHFNHFGHNHYHLYKLGAAVAAEAILHDGAVLHKVGCQYGNWATNKVGCKYDKKHQIKILPGRCWCGETFAALIQTCMAKGSQPKPPQSPPAVQMAPVFELPSSQSKTSSDSSSSLRRSSRRRRRSGVRRHKNSPRRQEEL